MHPGVQSGVLDAVTGNVVATIQHQKVGIIWRIYQLTVLYPTQGSVQASLAVNGILLSTPVLITSGAAASGYPSVDIGRADALTVNLTNTPFVGTKTPVTVAYFYDELTEDTGM